MKNAQTNTHHDYHISLIAPNCEYDDCDNNKRDRMCKYCKHGPDNGEHCYYWRYDKNGSNHHQHMTIALMISCWVMLVLGISGLLWWITAWELFGHVFGWSLLATLVMGVVTLISETVEPEMKDELRNSTFRQEMGYVMQRDGKGVPRVFVYRDYEEK